MEQTWQQLKQDMKNVQKKLLFWFFYEWPQQLTATSLKYVNCLRNADFQTTANY